MSATRIAHLVARGAMIGELGAGLLIVQIVQCKA